MSITKSYKAYAAKRISFGFALFFLLLLSCIWAVNVGSYSLSLGEIMQALSGETSTANLILWNIRLPRVTAAIVVGAGLAVSGAVLQCILRNP
ncbi:iron chelate uptake ABC transporter family permease subunit, partial [Candidatus Aerophobetes bacterium]|nr:iron chelate uptake ABC transporter family permease subunit [Candidatus Aerophobetes bacterium]